MTTLIRVYGTYLGADGTAQRGLVIFTPRSVMSTVGEQMLSGEPVTATLASDGSFTVQLQATDAAGLNPNGWTYGVREVLNGLPDRLYDITVPAADLSGGLNIADVTPLPSPSTGQLTQAGFSETLFVNGQSNYPRAAAFLSFQFTSGLVYAVGFLAARNMPGAFVGVGVAGADGVTTAAYVGLMSLAANGDATLIGTSASTPSIGTGTGWHKTAILNPPALVAGKAYAAVFLFVGGSPSLYTCDVISAVLGTANVQPWFGQTLAGGASVLPASYVYNAGQALIVPPYMEITTT